MENLLDLINSNVKNKYLACITDAKDNKFLLTTIIDDENNKIICKFSITDLKNFFDLIPTIFTKAFKGVIFQVFHFHSFLPLYQSNHDFCKALKEKFMEIQVQTYFLSTMDWMLSIMIVNKSYKSKINDVVSYMTISDNEGFVIDLLYTQNGYDKICSNAFPLSLNVEMIRREALQGNPKTIFYLNFGRNSPDVSSKMESVKALLSKGKTFIDFTDDIINDEVIIQVLKCIVDKNYIQCKFLPLSLRDYVLRLQNDECPILSVPAFNSLPAKVKKIVDKVVHDVIVTSEDRDQESQTAILYTCSPNPLAHRHEIILHIDEENLASYEVKPIILKEIKNLPKFLAKNKSLIVPVIGFLKNLSFICIQKDEKAGYEFLQSWNGVYGTDLYLAFNQEKPSFGETAIKFLETLPTCVVYDIIKIMSMPPESIQDYKTESFKITKDAENPVLLEFVNHEGEIKAASPSFLMALLLKQHLKAIKNECRKKPKAIAIILFDHLTFNERIRIETQMTEACKMLKVSCSFIKR